MNQSVKLLKGEVKKSYEALVDHDADGMNEKIDVCIN